MRAFEVKFERFEESAYFDNFLQVIGVLFMVMILTNISVAPLEVFYYSKLVILWLANIAGTIAVRVFIRALRVEIQECIAAGGYTSYQRVPFMARVTLSYTVGFCRWWMLLGTTGMIVTNMAFATYLSVTGASFEMFFDDTNFDLFLKVLVGYLGVNYTIMVIGMILAFYGRVAAFKAQ